jgi:hypothetical protein
VRQEQLARRARHEPPPQAAETLADAPQARRIEADDDHAAFGNEDALDLAQSEVRIASELERVRQDDEVERPRCERQRVEVTAQRRRRHDVHARCSVGNRRVRRDVHRASGGRVGNFFVTRGLHREPAMRHPVRLQRVELRQPELQRVESEQVGDGAVEMALLPLEQDLPDG